MSPGNAIQSIRYKDHKLWIEFRFSDDAKILTENPAWKSKDQWAWRELPESALYHYVTGQHFVIGFGNAGEAEAWSKPHTNLWEPSPEEPSPNEPSPNKTPAIEPLPNEPPGTSQSRHERLISLYYTQSNLRKALGKEEPKLERKGSTKKASGSSKRSPKGTSKKVLKGIKNKVRIGNKKDDDTD